MVVLRWEYDDVVHDEVEERGAESRRIVMGKKRYPVGDDYDRDDDE